MTTSTQWQLARESAERCQNILTPAILGPFAKALVDFAMLQRNEWVVDVGCGTGPAKTGPLNSFSSICSPKRKTAREDPDEHRAVDEARLPGGSNYQAPTRDQGTETDARATSKQPGLSIGFSETEAPVPTRGDDADALRQLHIPSVPRAEKSRCHSAWSAWARAGS